MNFRLLHLLFLVVSFFLCFSCTDKRQQTREFTFEESMTAEDTASVIGLIDKFYTYVKAKDYQEAAAMLYKVNPNYPKGQPILLDDEQLNEVIQMLSTLPVIDYNIKYMKFIECYENEVMCNVVVQKGTDGMPDITSKMFFRPMNFLGNWCLSIMNTTWGDRGIVSPSDRDSLARKYIENQKDSI
jgi:hypothetical protein